MLTSRIPCQLHPREREMVRLLARPLAPYVPLQQVSPDPGRPPDEGSLGWLLTYGLSSNALRWPHTVGLVTESGFIAHDPGLAQVWDHARQFYRAEGGPKDTIESSCFAALPAPGAPGAPRGPGALQLRRGGMPTPTFTDCSEDGFPPREEAFRQLNMSLAQGFMETLSVSLPDFHADPGPSRAELRKVIATDYILDRPVDPLIIQNVYAKRSQAKAWSAREVFNLEAHDLANVLNMVAEADIDALDIDAEPDPAIRHQLRCAAEQFLRYVERCVGRVNRMRPSTPANA